MKEFCNGRVMVKTGDITGENVDAIVNAANSSLLGGGGVDGALHRAGGPDILDECRKVRTELYPDGLPTGGAVTTTAGNLKARYVIHTVGPVWHGGSHDEERLLEDCYRNSLDCAVEHGCETIAFPAISTGVYRFPKNRAAVIASGVVKSFLDGNDTIKQVIFVFFSSEDESVFLGEHVL